MATTNPFDLLVDDDNDDPTQLLQKLPAPPVKKSPAPAAVAVAQPPKTAKLPSKPLPPSQAVREARIDGQRGGYTGGRGTGRGRGGRFNRDSTDNENSFSSSNGFSGGYRQPEEGDTEKSSERRGYGGPRGVLRGSPRGGRRGGFSNGDAADGERPPRRMFERHSGTGRGNEFVKRDGAGRGNWGSPTDDIAEGTEELFNDGEKNVDVEKQTGEEDVGDDKKENPVAEPEEKEPEVEEMTLEEYEKVLEEKRKALLALKSEERKVDLDKDFESMQLLSSKKNDEEVFVKLGSDKDKRKEAAEKEERAKKSLSINEFLKPADGERYYGPGSRGRGRGRGPRGGYGGGNMVNNVSAPKIEDVGQFPTLGAK